MIDCSKTEFYMTEKNRMTKAYESGVCRIRCENCPLDKVNNGKHVSCMQLELKYPKWAILIVQGWSNANPQKHTCQNFCEIIQMPILMMLEYLTVSVHIC